MAMIQTGLRLVSADAVKDIICQYENRAIQKTMVYKVDCLPGCLATEEQMLDILGDEEMKVED